MVKDIRKPPHGPSPIVLGVTYDFYQNSWLADIQRVVQDLSELEAPNSTPDVEGIGLKYLESLGRSAEDRTVTAPS